MGSLNARVFFRCGVLISDVQEAIAIGGGLGMSHGKAGPAGQCDAVYGIIWCLTDVPGFVLQKPDAPYVKGIQRYDRR